MSKDRLHSVRAVICVCGVDLGSPEAEELVAQLLAHCARRGYEVAGIALGEGGCGSAFAMVDDGDADRVLFLAPDHLPSVVEFVTQAAITPPGRARPRRTR